MTTGTHETKNTTPNWLRLFDLLRHEGYSPELTECDDCARPIGLQTAEDAQEDIPSDLWLELADIVKDAGENISVAHCECCGDAIGLYECTSGTPAPEDALALH